MVMCSLYLKTAPINPIGHPLLFTRASSDLCVSCYTFFLLERGKGEGMGPYVVKFRWGPQECDLCHNLGEWEGEVGIGVVKKENGLSFFLI